MDQVSDNSLEQDNPAPLSEPGFFADMRLLVLAILTLILLAWSLFGDSRACPNLLRLEPHPQDTHSPFSALLPLGVVPLLSLFASCCAAVAGNAWEPFSLFPFLSPPF
jgi:hypothetical protein